MTCHSCRSSYFAIGPLVIGVILAGFTPACGPGQVEPDGVSTTSPGTDETGAPDPTTETGDGDPSTTTEPDPTMTSLGFVPHPDFWEPYTCDTFLQDCPEGEKCVPYASTGGTWDALKCVSVLGDQGVGDPCTYDGVAEATDDCDASSYCWDAMEVEGELVGTCHAFCTGTPDVPMCPPNSSCNVSGSGVIALCISTCDPLVQDCDEGLACYWTNNTFSCIFTTQDIPTGEPCGFINDCVGGDICLTAEVLPACEGSACCAPYCDLELGDGPCAVLPGTSCVPFFPDDTAPPGYEQVGVCVVP